MESNPELIPACGLYCGVCKIYQATQENDRAYLKRLARLYERRLPELAPIVLDDLLCDGCRSGRKSLFCRVCQVRDCACQKSYHGCHQCAEFPCELIEEFPVPEGKKVILQAIPYRREHGTSAWILWERQRYRCPECGTDLYRGCTQCPGCKTLWAVD